MDDGQYTFVPGRNIQDNILIAHEMIRRYNRKNLSPRCIVEMDIQKAYDTIEWSALEYIMKEMSFPREIIDWIMIYISIVSYRYTING